MSFISVYEANGIGIENFYYSRIGMSRTEIDYDTALNMNNAFFSANVPTRIGPAFTEEGKVMRIGTKKFVPAIYIPREELSKLRNPPENPMSFKEAMNKLERTLLAHKI